MQRIGVEPMGWDDLPMLDASRVAQAEVDLAGLSGRVWRLAGLDVRMRVLEPPARAMQHTSAPGSTADTTPAVHSGSAVQLSLTDPIEGGVWWHVQWGGQPLVLHLNDGLASALARALGFDLADLSDEALDLLGHWRGGNGLPPGLAWVQAARDPTRLSRLMPGDVPQGAPLRHWTAVHAGSGEPCGFEVCMHAPPGFALQRFYAAFESQVVARDPSTLGQLPWPLPLVAARWNVDAELLHDLSVGDVLLLET
jgi:hypothetical protein